MSMYWAKKETRMAKMSRDPRIDPQVGDILERSRKCIDCTRTYRRTVVQLPKPHKSGTGVNVQWVVYKVKTGSHAAVPLQGWRTWAKDARLIA